MKLARKVGATSQIFQIFIADSSSTTGAGLTGLTSASSGLTAYYHRDTDTTATAISLVTMTVGTFTSSGFKEIDSTHMPGWYQFCPPNAALASGAASVGFHLKGATNMAPLPIEVDLDSQVDVTFWNGTVVASPATAGIPDVNVKNMNNVAATSITTIKAVQGLTTADTIVNLTNAPTAGDFTAAMKTSLNAATPASVVGAVGSVTGSVGSVTAAVAITSNRKKGSGATFEFLMQDATTGAPKTGLTVAATISKDGGAPGATSNSVSEIGLGQYQIVLTATEMTANNIFLQFTSAGAVTTCVAIQTQP